MKIDYIETGAIDCPILRVFDNDSDSIKRLMDFASRQSKGLTHISLGDITI